MVVLGTIIVILVALYLSRREDVSSVNNVENLNVIDMSKKYNHNCPFCHEKIPKITETQTIVKRRRHKVKTKKITVVIGEDWATHVKTCQALKEFLNKTKL
jgi:hypothetical protein